MKVTDIVEKLNLKISQDMMAWAGRLREDTPPTC